MRLVREFPLVHIRDGARHHAALKVIDDLAGRKRTPEEEAYLGVLVDIVSAYEDRHWPVEPVGHDAMLDFLLESRDVSPAALARTTRIAEATIADVLRGKKRLTREQAVRIAAWFEVSTDLFGA
jgi:antitoxin component HigA of HigAB toxin-antitoxin module